MKLFGLDIKKAIKTEKKDFSVNYNTTSNLNFDAQYYSELFGFNYSEYEHSNDSYVKKAYIQNLYVYSIINYIITSASSVKFKLFKTLSDDRVKEIYSHPILDLINKPNAHQSRNEFIENILGYKLLTGNSYINMPNKYELYCLPATDIKVIPDNSYLSVKGYQLLSNPSATFTTDEILHLRYFNPVLSIASQNNFYGLSPLSSALSHVQTQNEAIQTLLRSYQNCGMQGILSNKSEYEELSPEQLSQVQQKFKDMNTGSQNAGSVMVSNTQFDFIKTGLSPVDLSILEYLKVSFEQICATFKFPSILLQNESATYNNKVEAKKQLYLDVIIPELDNLLDSLNGYFSKAFGAGYILKIDMQSIPSLQADKVALADYLNKAFWLTINEKRLADGYSELNEPDNIGDSYILPKEVQIIKTLSDIILPAQPQPKPNPLLLSGSTI